MERSKVLTDQQRAFIEKGVLLIDVGFDAVVQPRCDATLQCRWPAIDDVPAVRSQLLVIAASSVPHFEFLDLVVEGRSQIGGGTRLPAAVFAETAIRVRLDLDRCPFGGSIALVVHNGTDSPQRMRAMLGGPAVL